MQVKQTDQSLLLEDRPAFIWALGAGLILLGMVLLVLPWLVADGYEGKKVLAARIATTLFGASGIGGGLYILNLHPAFSAEFNRAERRLSVCRRHFNTQRWQIPFQSIEVLTIGQKKTEEGKYIYRIAVGTRNGERVPLSRWQDQEQGMKAVVRQVEKWIRT